MMEMHKAARGGTRNSFGPPSSACTAFLRRNGRDLPSQIPALAILVPYRGYATEVSDTPRGGPAIPPPGFNVKEAKKPLPKEREVAKSAKPSDTNSTSELSTDATRNVSSTSKEATAAATTATEEVKDERTLAQLAESVAAAKAEEKKEVGEAKKPQQKLTIMQKIKREVNHYWDGTKLLGAEVKISTRLALKMAAGYELSRRENRQVSLKRKEKKERKRGFVEFGRSCES
jgi:LETM1 and EF-hand domain-containing protein 1